MGGVMRSKDRVLLYSRPQLLLFSPGAEEEGARDHIRDLCDAGCNALRQITMMHHSESKHNVTQEAMIIYNNLVVKDVFQLHGPRVTFHQPTAIMDPAIADPGPQGSEEEAAADYSDLEADWELQCADGGPPTPGWDLP